MILGFYSVLGINSRAVEMFSPVLQSFFELKIGRVDLSVLC
jgi:hypothetical protein